MFAQNQPGLLDAGIAIQSYPDMVTQTIPISDCPLLGQYFKEEAERNPASPWARWRNHALIQGMNASDSSTECIAGWKMAMPTVLNPVYKDPKFDAGARQYGYPANVFANVKWTHWNDLAEVYGTDAGGYAPIPVDNVGVQYGLAALAQGRIGVDEFLRIKACVGGWKEQSEFVNWDKDADPFDSRNMKRSPSCRDPAGTPSPRRAGDVGAMQKAYASGHVFTGQLLAMPVIDLLLSAGAAVTAFDPIAMPEARKVLNGKVAYADTLQGAVEKADGVLLVTRWPEFKALPEILAARNATAAFVDGRRLIEKDAVPGYAGIGLG